MELLDVITCRVIDEDTDSDTLKKINVDLQRLQDQRRQRELTQLREKARQLPPDLQGVREQLQRKIDEE